MATCMRTLQLAIMLGGVRFFVSGVEQIGDIPLASCTRTSFRLRSSEFVYVLRFQRWV